MTKMSEIYVSGNFQVDLPLTSNVASYFVTEFSLNKTVTINNVKYFVKDVNDVEKQIKPPTSKLVPDPFYQVP